MVPCSIPNARPAIEQAAQDLAGVGLFDCGDFLGRARGDDPSAAAPPSGPRSMTQSAVLITSRLCSTTSTVLPASTKSCSTFEQQARCRQSAGRSSARRADTACGRCCFLTNSRASLMSLGLAARKGGRGLAELHIVEPHVVQRLQLVLRSWECFRSARGPAGRPFPALRRCDLALEADLQRFAIEAVSVADRAGDPDVGQEIHFQPVRAVSLAGFAPPALRR